MSKYLVCVALIFSISYVVGRPQIYLANPTAGAAPVSNFNFVFIIKINFSYNFSMNFHTKWKILRRTRISDKMKQVT